MNNKFTSNAEWPREVCPSIGHMPPKVTSDSHDCEEMALSVCNALADNGYGGGGKIFPVRVWVVEHSL